MAAVFRSAQNRLASPSFPILSTAIAIALTLSLGSGCSSSHATQDAATAADGVTAADGAAAADAVAAVDRAVSADGTTSPDGASAADRAALADGANLPDGPAAPDAPVPVDGNAGDGGSRGSDGGGVAGLDTSAIDGALSSCPSSCPTSAPVCDDGTRSCRACRVNAECLVGPGVCLASGACATDSDVVYVTWQGGGCSPAADGSALLPFCFVSDALTRVSSTRSTIFIQGENPGFTLDVGIPLTITAAPSARIIARGRTAISLLGGDVTLRELVVTGSSYGVDITGPSTHPSASATLVRVTVSNNGTGVYVHNRAQLRMDSCLFEDNTGMGIYKGGDSGDVSIENTVFVRNDRGIDIAPTPYGATVFRNNTLLANTTVAIECATAGSGSPPTLAGILAYGNGSQIALCPTPSDACLGTCSATDPMLDTKNDGYRLTAASPAACKDVLDTAPATDRKGISRPQGQRSDCGADEYVP